MFRHPYLTFIILSLFAGASLSYAREVKLTTYYPSPNGNYDNLKTNKLFLDGTVNSASDRSCVDADNNAIADGRIMMDSNDGSIFTCDSRLGNAGAPYWRGDGVTRALFPSNNAVKIGYQYNEGTKFTGLNLSGSTLQLVNDGASFLDISPTQIAVPNNKNLVLNGGNIVLSAGATKEYYYDLDLTGNVGLPSDTIGLRSQKKLAVFADTRGESFYGIGYSDRVLQFHSGSSSGEAPQMVLKGSFLGLNNTAPAVELDVVGDQHLTGNATIDGNITTTAGTITGANVIATNSLKLPTQQPATLENGMMWLE